MTPIRWIIFAVVAVVALGSLVFLSAKDRIDVSNVDTNAIVRDGEYKDNVYGNPDAKVVIVEYGDFQCPGCGGAYSRLKVIKEAYGDDIAFVYRHFPLTSIHPNALAAAAAAEAAGLQGKFWEMHDLLFEGQDSWENLSPEQRGPQFELYAQSLGLDLGKFNSDLSSEQVSKKIAYDRAVGGKAGASSTPTIILNGEKLTSEETNDLVGQTGAKLRDKIDALIKQNGGTPPSREADTNPVEPAN